MMMKWWWRVVEKQLQITAVMSTVMLVTTGDNVGEDKVGSYPLQYQLQ